jgi:hypothetical protein
VLFSVKFHWVSSYERVKRKSANNPSIPIGYAEEEALMSIKSLELTIFPVTSLAYARPAPGQLAAQLRR